MKKILYFSIGFAIPFIWFSLAYPAQIWLKAGEENPYPSPETQTTPTSGYEEMEFQDTRIMTTPEGWYPLTCGAACSYSTDCYAVQTYFKNVSGVISKRNITWINSTCDQSSFQSTPVLPDADGDGIPDKYDLKPDSSSSYKAGIISVCYDENHKVVAGIIQDGEGNQYTFGTMPTDFEGYTIESVTGDLITYQTGEDLATTLGRLDIDDLNITRQNTPVEIQDDGTIIPGTTNPFRDYQDAERDQTRADTPTVQPTPTVTSQETDTDSKSLKNVVDNTNSTNKNLENMQGYLQITNDNLAQINKNIQNLKSNSTGTGTSITVDTPTAEEIGQAVGDQLIDSGQTIDTTTTDNITSLDETDTLTEIKTKYSDRYDLFINTLKGSDLFTLPFSIFTGPSGSGSSVQTVDIGSWGESSSRTATIDFSQYDNVWNILSGILLMLTSFACFKIIVLKKA